MYVNMTWGHDNNVRVHATKRTFTSVWPSALLLVLVLLLLARVCVYAMCIVYWPTLTGQTNGQ